MDILFIWSLPVLPHGLCFFLTLVLTQGQGDEARCVGRSFGDALELGFGVPFAKGAIAVPRCLGWGIICVK